VNFPYFSLMIRIRFTKKDTYSLTVFRQEKAPFEITVNLRRVPKGIA